MTPPVECEGTASLGVNHSLTFDRRQSRNHVAGRLMERDVWQDELAATFAGLLPPSAVVIEGEPGLGKTALLNAACHLAREAGHEVLYARGGAVELESPFGIVRQLFQSVEASLTPSEREMCTNVMAVPRTSVLRPILFEVIDDLYMRLSLLASRRPLVVAVDDLQWSDYESLVWLQYLSRRLESGRISLVGTATPRVAGTALAVVDNIIAEPSTRVLNLLSSERPFGGPTGRGTLGVRPRRLLRGACHRLTGGNPFLLHSLLSALGRGSLAAELSEEGLASLSLPPVARGILRRLGGLEAESQALLQAAAVLGEGAELTVVASSRASSSP